MQSAVRVPAILVVLAVVLLVQSGYAVPTVDSILARAIRNQQQVATLAGSISWQVSQAESTTRMRGRFYWSFPKFRYDLIEPEELHMIFDGTRLLTQAPAEREFRVKEMPELAEAGVGAEAPWMPSLAALESDCRFLLTGQGLIEGHNVWVLEGKVRDTSRVMRRVLVWLEKQEYEPMRLEVYGEGKYPSAIYMVDSLDVIDAIRVPIRYQTWVGVGDRTLHFVTELSRLRVNTPISDELFRIDLPGK